jgi:hypothetical protein
MIPGRKRWLIPLLFVTGACGVAYGMTRRAHLIFLLGLLLFIVGYLLFRRHLKRTTGVGDRDASEG